MPLCVAPRVLSFPALALCVLFCLAFCAVASPLGDACARFEGLDYDRDGTPEIELLRPAIGASADARGAARGLVLLVIEERLLRASRSGADLRGLLRRYARDLASEGLDVESAAVRLYAGPRHQDGLTLLALREFVRSVYADRPDLRGVVLIGRFPDALLVRQFNWWKRDPITLNQGKLNEVAYGGEGVDYLRSCPEVVATRADIVLGDLDGRWENVYRRERMSLPYALAAFPGGPGTLAEGPEAVETGALAFEDMFLVNDGQYRLELSPSGKLLLTLLPEPNTECSAADRALPNPMARPEIWVSRLDASHASVAPNPAVRGTDGRGLLDEAGKPQAVDFADEASVPPAHTLWAADEATERAMLADWLERRHRFRLGDYAYARKPASVGTGWGSALPAIKEAFPEWSSFAEEGYEVVREDVNLREVVDWLRRPAVIRSMKAHGDPWGCSWAEAPSVPDLEAAVGSTLYAWKRDGARLTPSLGATPGKLDFAITRSLYESGNAPEAPSVWLYTACEGTAPQGGAETPYTHPQYGFWQGAECLVFHLRGLSLIGRSKVFYDEPGDTWGVLGRGGGMGDVWSSYFESESQDGSLFTDNGIGRKRAYFWCVLGDGSARVLSP